MVLNTPVSVTKVQDVKTEDNFVTVTLKGSQVIVIEHYEDGFDITDIAEITITAKFGSLAAAKHVGIGDYGTNQVLQLKPRDATLKSFEESQEEPFPETNKALDDYRGIVPNETLDTIEGMIPERILKTIV